MASSKETYCLCGQPYNIGQFMIECDCCREWFHGSCVDVKIYHSDDIDKYHCPKCAQTYGPSVLKIPTNNHRADRYELGAESRPSQAGTPAWVRALAARPPRPAHAALQRMRASQFTDEFVRDNGFTRPVFFQTSEDLDMKTPNAATFTVRSVLRYCGAQLEVEVIDVRKQSTVRMPLGDFVEYFETPAARRDDRVLNVLSLEFSDTNLSPLVEPPGVIRRLDWATCVWPEAEGDPRPAVRKYCLMSSQGSYTDFHVDFGGTTVWYHVMHGRKIFYLIPPTSTNLALYQQWSAANNQNERFFGDMVEWYGTAELSAGQTLFIPSGWIHAVLTPCDSLVFGGNLLHSYAIEMQLQIYEIERRVETPTMFRYPLFEPMHWFAAAHVLATLRRHNEETQDEDFTLNSGSLPAPPPPPLLLRGAKALAAAAKDWHAAKSTDASKRDNVPKCLNSGQLVRELGKELRTLEKRAASTSSKDKEFKPRNTSPKKSHKSQQQQKKSLKLTLPKPIMHNISQNGEFVEEKVYADKFFIDNKEVTYHDNRYIPQDTKYLNGLPEAKYIVETKEVVLPEKYTYQSFEEVPFDGNGYVERQDKKGNVLRIKLNPSPPPRALPPPPYGTDHSILKAQLARDRPERPRHQQWTISKKDIGDYQEEVLFTNDNLQSNVGAQEITYGAGMYSAEDVHPAYAFEPKPAAYQPEYGYPPPPPAGYPAHPADYQRYEMQPPHQPATYGASAGPATAATATAGTVTVDAAGTTTTTVELNGYHEPLPSYDAAMAQQYSTGYVIEEAQPPSSSGPLPASPTVRRSERPARRRVSSTYDYEDGDLYIDDAPAPRRRQKKHRHQYKQTASSGAGYRGRAPPANGIESLIQASVLAEEEPNDTEDAAVAGMLSIATRCGPAVAVAVAVVPAVAPPSAPPAAPSPAAPALAPAPAPAHHTFGLPTTTKDSGRPGRRRAAAADEPSDEEEDVIKEVHRDEEYVYPALDPSSDEEDEWPSRRRAPRNDARAKADKDESWSPRARLGRLVPRARASARAGVRRECVRAALTAAARRDAARPAAPAERPARDPAGQNAKRAVLATKSKRPPPPAPATTNNKNIRLKKGMKTAKQRLGKILKIHKMIY